MPKFSITAVGSGESKPANEMRWVNLSQLEDDPMNEEIYNTDGIKELAADIELNGLMQYPLVRFMPGGMYRIISGHRRVKALRLLAKQDKEQWKTIPVILDSDKDETSIAIKLISANAVNRHMTRREQFLQAIKLYELLTEQKEKENLEMSQEECENTAKMIALAALKYGDLSNQASKDYVFDLERFISFEGNTGPYILYTIVRMKSILAKYEATGKSLADAKAAVLASESDSQKELMLSLAKFNGVMEGAVAEQAPHKICAYIYELANTFNGFYHGTKILSEEDDRQQKSYIALLLLTKGILETCIDVLGFSAPEKM